MDAAKAVVTKLKLKQFVPVENPGLQSTYRMIEETSASFLLIRKSYLTLDHEGLFLLNPQGNQFSTTFS